jgi:hypothetical protein
LLILRESIGPGIAVTEYHCWVIDFDEPAKVSNVDQPSSWWLSDYDG